MTRTKTTQALTITGYVGHSHPDVAASVEADIRPIENALMAANSRVERLTQTTPTMSDVRVEADGEVLLLHSDAPELDGAVLTLAPVGSTYSRLTALTVRLVEPFVGGEEGRRQFLAATSFVSGSTNALEHALAS